MICGSALLGDSNSLSLVLRFEKSSLRQVEWNQGEDKRSHCQQLKECAGEAVACTAAEDDAPIVTSSN